MSASSSTWERASSAHSITCTGPAHRSRSSRWARCSPPWRSSRSPCWDSRRRRTCGRVKLGGADYAYKWPLYFFIAVAFWNVVGAGVFGFLINPPIVLYYAQGMNTTPLHAHTALFGVYGILAIALMLFSVRHIVSLKAWSDRMLKWAFWLLNGGLLGMTVFSLAPSGFYQLYYAVTYGIWFARSPEITSGPVIRMLNYFRILPDVAFGLGGVVIFLFVVRATVITFSRKSAPATQKVPVRKAVSSR